MAIRSTSKFFINKKLHKPVGQVQFEVFEKFMGAYFTKLPEKSVYYFLIMYTKNRQRKSRQSALVLRENALVFSQSEVRNVFMYIIILLIRHLYQCNADSKILNFSKYKANK